MDKILAVYESLDSKVYVITNGESHDTYINANELMACQELAYPVLSGRLISDSDTIHDFGVGLHDYINRAAIYNLDFLPYMNWLEERKHLQGVGSALNVTESLARRRRIAKAKSDLNRIIATGSAIKSPMDDFVGQLRLRLLSNPEDYTVLDCPLKPILDIPEFLENEIYITSTNVRFGKRS